MIVPKGYRAREKAALQRKTRGRVDEEVRAQRSALLEDKIHNAVVKSRDSYELALVEAAPAVTDSVAPAAQPVKSELVAETSPENGEAIFEEDETSQDEAKVEAEVKPEAAPAAEPKGKSKAKKK
jgi:hypothetical protein